MIVSKIHLERFFLFVKTKGLGLKKSKTSRNYNYDKVEVVGDLGVTGGPETAK